MSTRTEERKRQAFSMNVRGYPDEEIAEIMGLALRTIEGYIKEFKAEAVETMRTINGDDYVAIAMARFAADREEIQANYMSANKPADRARFIKLRLQLNKEEAAFLRESGMLHKEPEKVVQQHNHNITIGQFMQSEVNLAQLDSMAYTMLSQRTGVAVDDLVGMMPSTKNYHSLARTDLLHLAEGDGVFDIPGDEEEVLEPVLINPLEKPLPSLEE